MKKVFLAFVLVPVFACLAYGVGGVKKKKVAPHEYGNVVIDNYSITSGLAPVIFEHWRHRSKFTCRVCHVDIGFAMKGNGTNIKAADNMRGYFCGTCHNGRMRYNDKVVFESCFVPFRKDDLPRCWKCHITGDHPEKEDDFDKFIDALPRGKYREHTGNKVDWEKLEEAKLIRPIDYIEGISIKRPALKIQKDFSLDAKVEGMSKIIFSHRKHTVWNGCEVCHPDIFIGIKKGNTKYSMVEIFGGKFCGVCHGTVAFPNDDCLRCHTESVQ